jgi:hypothetical protein
VEPLCLKNVTLQSAKLRERLKLLSLSSTLKSHLHCTCGTTFRVVSVELSAHSFNHPGCDHVSELGEADRLANDVKNPLDVFHLRSSASLTAHEVQRRQKC